MRKILSLGTVAFAGLVLGLVIGGGFGVTASTQAERLAPPTAAPALPAMYPDFASLADRVLLGGLGLHRGSRFLASAGEGGRIDPFEFSSASPPESARPPADTAQLRRR